MCLQYLASRHEGGITSWYKPLLWHQERAIVRLRGWGTYWLLERISTQCLISWKNGGGLPTTWSYEQATKTLKSITLDCAQCDEHERSYPDRDPDAENLGDNILRSCCLLGGCEHSEQSTIDGDFLTQIAVQTRKLQPMPRRKISSQLGVSAFLLSRGQIVDNEYCAH